MLLTHLVIQLEREGENARCLLQRTELWKHNSFNSEFIFPHLTRPLDRPCVHKIIPVKGTLLVCSEKHFAF